MEYIKKLEKIVLGWTKNVPHLPPAGQKWLGTNVWWIVLIGAIISGIAILVSLNSLFVAISLLSALSNTYYVTSSFSSLAILSISVGLAFTAAVGVILAFAVKPLQNKQKKGWVLLFLALLVEALSVVVKAVLSFSVLGFIFSLLFGAIALAIAAYFIFEIHGQFGHQEKVAAKSEKTTKAV